MFDTNVLVALYVFADRGLAPLRARIESGDWLAITDEACFEEFRRVLTYPAVAEAQQKDALAAYGASVGRVIRSQRAVAATLPRCRDRDDQKFLELARDGCADWLVTADKALLRLRRSGGLRGLFRILSPVAALAET